MKALLSIALFAIAFSAAKAQTKAVSINPTSGNKGQTLAVTITGVGTHFAMGTNTVQFIRQGSPTTNLMMSGMKANSNTSLTGTLNIAANAEIGYYAFVVGNLRDSLIRSSNEFQVKLVNSTGTLTSIAPNTGTQAQTLDVTITGSGTSFTSGTNTLSIRQGSNTTAIKVNSVTAQSATSIKANISINSIAPTGTYGVYVANVVNGIMGLENAFTVTEQARKASLVSIAPAVGGLGEKVTVLIMGSNTGFDKGVFPPLTFLLTNLQTAGVILGTTTAVLGSASFAGTVDIPATATPGLYDLSVYSPGDGLLTLAGIFEVTAKTASRIYDDFIYDVKTWPNPVQNKLNIESHTPLQSVEIFDLNGKSMFRQDFTTHDKKGVEVLTDFPRGVYLLKVNSASGTQTSKFIIE